MKIKEYEQTTCETCLAVNLLLLAGVDISQKKELEVLYYALTFSKNHFVIGHLDFMAKNFGLRFDYYVDNAWFFNFTKKIGFSNKINLMQKKIDLRLIDELIKASPVIVFVDSFYLWKINHYPHFIIILQKSEKSYKIFDPWDGKTKQVLSNVLSKSIISLRNLLKFCPQIIQIHR